MNANAHNACPGERWLVNFRPIDATAQAFHEATVILIDFDPRTDTWTVEADGTTGPTALDAKHLIRRLD
jgi:hypothetical protein